MKLELFRLTCSIYYLSAFYLNDEAMKQHQRLVANNDATKCLCERCTGLIAIIWWNHQTPIQNLFCTAAVASNAKKIDFFCWNKIKGFRQNSIPFYSLAKSLIFHFSFNLFSRNRQSLFEIVEVRVKSNISIRENTDNN